MFKDLRLNQCASSRSFQLILCFVLLTTIPRCQTGQPKPDALPKAAGPVDLDGAIEHIKSGLFTSDDIETVFEERVTQVIPILESQFAQTQDLDVRENIARAVVKLGDRTDVYWDFLARQAADALEDDAPFFLSFNENGQLTKEPSPDFLKWATAHHLDPDQAVENELYKYPGAIMDIGFTGDARAVPLLRRALLSPNILIQAAASRGLAEVHDQESISLIIEACKRAPAESAAQIATPLVFFDDSQAQKGVDLYVPKEFATLAREARAAGEGPFGEKLLHSTVPK